MAVAREDHGFRTAADVERAVGVHRGHVARMEPSLLVEDLVGVLVVFVVSLHNVLAADEDFAGHALRVFRVDPHFEQSF